MAKEQKKKEEIIQEKEFNCPYCKFNIQNSKDLRQSKRYSCKNCGGYFFAVIPPKNTFTPFNMY